MPDRNDTIEQIASLIDVQAAKRARLAALNVQAAQHGNDAPPHVTTEIKAITNELAEIGRTISKLERSLRRADFRPLDYAPPDGAYAPPPLVTPSSLGEQVIALFGMIGALGVATEKEFHAVQMAIYKLDEDRQRDHAATRDVIREERDDRRGARDEDNDAHHGRHKELARWVWFIGLALLLLFVAFVLYASNQYLRELYLQGGR